MAVHAIVMYLLHAVIGNSGRCLVFFYDLLGKQGKIYTDGCESIQDRAGDVFSCFAVTLKNIR